MISMATGGNPAIVNYDMFVGVFSFLTLFYVIMVAFKEGAAGHPALPALLDGLNVLFFLCAGIATAAYLQTGSCNDAVSFEFKRYVWGTYCILISEQKSYRDSNFVTSGSTNNFQRCREAQAVTTFIWFNLVLYIVSLIFTVGGASSSGVNMRGIGGIRRGPAPSMSQV